MSDHSNLKQMIQTHRRNRFSILSYNTWVSPERRYLYVSTPKAACTRIKMTLQQLEGYPVPRNGGALHNRDVSGCPFLPSLTDFNDAKCLEILTSDDWYRFAFVRNPYYRLFSAYKSKLLNEFEWQYKRYGDAIRSRGRYPVRDGKPAGRIVFSDFLHFVSETSDEERDSHWRSQHGLLMMDCIAYHFIGRMERFAEDFGEVLRRFRAPETVLATVSEEINPTVKIYHAAAYDRELADLLFQTYRRDFETFGYDPDSWLFDD